MTPRTVIKGVRLTPAELATCKRHARRCGLPLAAWLRSRLLEGLEPARELPNPRQVPIPGIN